MSEAIIIALIGIIPSVLVAIVTIVSNNAIIKMRITELEKTASKQNEMIDKTYRLEETLLGFQSRYFDLRERVDQLEYGKQRKDDE